MKHIMTMLLLLTATLISLPANAQVKDLEKYSKTDGVSYAYISKTMLQLASSEKIGIPGLNMKKKELIDKISGIQIISTEKKASSSKLKKEIESITSRDKYETLMEMGEEEKLVIYYKSGKKQSAIIMVTEEDSGLSIIAITGAFSPKDVKDLGGSSQQ